MAVSLTTRIFWIACCAIVPHALPITDENDSALYLNETGYLEETSNVETFAIGAKEGTSTALMDSPKSTGPSEAGELDNETMAMTNMTGLYGVKDNTERSTRKKRYIEASNPPMCENARLDAIIRTASGSVFAFQGYHYWKLHDNGIREGYPRPIKEDWEDLEENIDAAFTLPNGDTYFFKGAICWKFFNKIKDQDFPKETHLAFGGKLPQTINATFFSTKDNKTYVFDDNNKKVWQYRTDDRPVDAGYPKAFSEWRNLTLDYIDAAIQWDSQKTYFFKDQEYFEYRDADCQDTCQTRQGHSIGKRWFGCP